MHTFTHLQLHACILKPFEDPEPVLLRVYIACLFRGLYPVYTFLGSAGLLTQA